MIIKEKQGHDEDIRRLDEMLEMANLSARQRQLIHDEILRIRSGEQGERNAAYFINFELRQSKNYAVIHDLRIEHEERVVQIDHLIIGRMAEVILIESKNVSTALQINDLGEFEVKTRYGWKGMASPVEQNKRHIDVLKGFLRTSELLPRRLGLQLAPAFYHWVLVPADCSLGKSRTCPDIVKMDMFRARFESWINRKDTNEVLKMAKVISSETLREFATALASQHRTHEVDYRGKFGITASPGRKRTIMPASPLVHSGAAAPVVDCVCATCSERVDERVSQFCRQSPTKFRGRILCRSCQKSAAKHCDECTADVDAKVEAFCRFNSKRLGKKLLCRRCQQNYLSQPVSNSSPVFSH